MNIIIDNLLMVPIIAFIGHYLYSFYSHYYKTNRNTISMEDLIGSKVYRDRALKK